MKQSLFYFMQAHDHDDVSDGAWQAMLEDAVEMFNDQNNTAFDPHNMFHEYLQWRTNNAN